LPDSVEDPKQIVESGYDRIAERYAAWTGEVWEGARERYGSLLLARLPAGATVLDLGCGAGTSATRELAKRFAVTGVDISGHSIELARQHVPHATFIHSDLATVTFPPESFDAVVAFYSLIHVPRDEHTAVLRAIARWLRPGGLVIATMGARATEDGYEDDWLGAPMYWSHFDTATNVRLVSEAGLRLLEANEETEEEDGVPVTHLWIVAQKPPRSDAGR
jgi:ubiquinone/menaquinone biosynthesis C-methylase UbiE